MQAMQCTKWRFYYCCSVAVSSKVSSPGHLRCIHVHVLGSSIALGELELRRTERRQNQNCTWGLQLYRVRPQSLKLRLNDPGAKNRSFNI